MKDKKGLLLVAQIGKTIGLKGELKFHVYSDFYNYIEVGTIFFDEQGLRYEVVLFNKVRNTIKFKTINSIDLANKIVNKKPYQSIEDTKKIFSLKEEEFFYFDIQDCLIIEKEEVLGKVSQIDRFNEKDFLLITTSDSLQDKMAKIFLIPYEDNYIINVDINNKKIFTKNAKDILEQSWYAL